MDSIQKVLVKAGRKDLAQKYYKKVAFSTTYLLNKLKIDKNIFYIFADILDEPFSNGQIGWITISRDKDGRSSQDRVGIFSKKLGEKYSYKSLNEMIKGKENWEPEIKKALEEFKKEALEVMKKINVSLS